MARARNIKPGFFQNPDLAECSAFGRLLFIGLWTLADRAGRMEDRPRNIKFQLFPSDSFDIEQELADLEKFGFINRYEVDGGRYLEILNFGKHQNPHVKEVASTIPAPCKPGASPVLDEIGEVPAGLIPDSGSLIPDPGSRINSSSEESPLPPVGEPEGVASPKPKAKTILTAELERRFREFWVAYPRKTAIDDARKAWDKLRPDDELTAEMLTALQWQSRSEQWTRERGKYIPYPATWLNKGHWKDEPVLSGSGPILTVVPDDPIYNDPVLHQLARERKRNVQGKLGVTAPSIAAKYDREIADIDSQLIAKGVTPEEAEQWARSH